MMCAMKNFRMVLSPLLTANYVFGLRIVEFPAGHPRSFSLVYILLIWLVYCFFQNYGIINKFMDNYVNLHRISYWIDISTILLSIMFGVYHDKKLRNCLKKITIVDVTLEKLGITTNYQQLHTRTIWTVSVWFIITMSLNYTHFLFLGYNHDYDTVTKIYLSLTLNHCSHLNLLGDLTITTIFGYIGIKFDQINEYLQNLVGGNKYAIKQAWKNSILHSPQRSFQKTSDNEWRIWTLMHLHLELCKLSREIDTIFGMQMTFKMGCYFYFMSVDLYEIFNVFFDCYIKKQKDILFIGLNLAWLFHNILKLLVINYMCEKVSKKANIMGNFADGMSRCTNDVEICENISQLLLQMALSPLKFYGLGLFQFGFKFLRGFITSVTTVLVILIQSHTDK